MRQVTKLTLQPLPPHPRHDFRVPGIVTTPTTTTQPPSSHPPWPPPRVTTTPCPPHHNNYIPTNMRFPAGHMQFLVFLGSPILRTHVNNKIN